MPMLPRYCLLRCLMPMMPFDIFMPALRFHAAQVPNNVRHGAFCFRSAMMPI